jgi:hypothetical protein
MSRILLELIKKYGPGFVLGAVTLDGYRRTVMNDRNNQVLDKISAELETVETSRRELHVKIIEEAAKKTKKN